MSEPRRSDLDNPFTLHAGAGEFQFRPPQPPIVSIQGDAGQPLVTIHPNGELEYGPGYTPDEAARRFWDAIRYYMPAHCLNCGQVAGTPTSKEQA